MSCSPIDKGVVFSCLPQQGGLENYFILLNYEDWKASTITQDGTTKEITAITLAAGGKQGYKFEVPKGENIVAESPLRAVDGADGFDHQVSARVQTIEQLDVETFEKMRFVKVVIIVPLLDGRAKVYGGHIDETPTPIGVGMRISEYNDMPGDAATGGSIQFIAKTPDNDPPEMRAPHLISSDFDLSTLLTPTA